MGSSVDPTLEIAAIVARLQALTGETYEGVPQGEDLPRDAYGRKDPYRDFEAGSVIPSAQQRGVSYNEQQQPHVWAFQVHHYAPTRAQARNLAIETDRSLIGWGPTVNASPVSTFFFTMYDETAKNGEKIGIIATRFYETELGQSPDFSLTI